MPAEQRFFTDSVQNANKAYLSLRAPQARGNLRQMAVISECQTTDIYRRSPHCARDDMWWNGLARKSVMSVFFASRPLIHNGLPLGYVLNLPPKESSNGGFSRLRAVLLSKCTLSTNHQFRIMWVCMKGGMEYILHTLQAIEMRIRSKGCEVFPLRYRSLV